MLAANGRFVTFLVGMIAGMIFQSNWTFLARILPEYSSLYKHPEKQCKICKEDQYWYVRERVPFRGPISTHPYEQYEQCMPLAMRYQFTLNGTIGVNGNEPSKEGQGEPDVGGVGPNQIYAPLSTTKKHLFGGRKDGRTIWSKDLLDYLIAQVQAGIDISCADYPKSALDVKWALQLLGVGQGDRLLVGGSISPWVEAIALYLGTGEVTTVDYSVPVCDECHPRLRTIHMDTLMKRITPAGYSFIVSYSSVEHDGLGRYGDPLDPYGDMHAMNEFWHLLQDDGILLLAIPLWDKDMLAHLLARLYGPVRLPWLIQGWEYLGCVNREHWSARVPFKANDWGWHPIIALRKTTGKSLCTLNCTNSSAKENTLRGFNACRPTEACGELSRHWPRLNEFSDATNNGSEARILRQPAG